MKKILLSVLLFFAITSTYAQRNLEIRDVSTELNVFSGKDTEAGMVISCPMNIELTFESTHDKVVDVFNQEQKGEENYYYLRFNTGRRYSGRKLTMRANDFNPITIDADLSPKELKQYKLLDPDAEFVYGCYYEYRKRGTEFFQQAMYIEAREQYSVAKECSDCPSDSNIEELISNIDSIMVYQANAEDAYKTLNYQKASELYAKILTLNPTDTNASEKRYTSSRLYDADCNKYYDAAELYMENGEYDKALELYQRVVNENCGSAVAASEKARQIQVLLQNRKQKARVVAYEYSKSAPIGITTGSYKSRKVGGYFSFSLHPDAFKLIQNDYDKAEKAEMNMSFGWTLCPVKEAPVWLFFGPGFTLLGRYENTKGDGSIYIPYSYKPGATPEEIAAGKVVDEPSLKIHGAISPEIGLLGKIGPVVLRYTFQYRFPLSKDDKELINKTRHVFGIGLCF